MTLCGGRESSGEIWRSYGGHYFSPVQSLAFDILLAHLPSDPARRAICLSSVIIAASQCAAAPGHTAQPFKATTRAAPFLREAWERDVFQYVDRAIEILSTKSAKVQGIARVGDATVIAKTLHEDDLVFVDPPYSGVHYSRFYHVLETIARGKCGPVDGVGRYPPAIERPVSAFSRKGQSAQALRSLLNSLAVSGCTCIFTFPSGQCSNGLSGDILLEIARESHRIRVKTVETKFSTLGGNNRHRHARRVSEELMLLLKPK
jgi:adenine-specific DNA methylase